MTLAHTVLALLAGALLLPFATSAATHGDIASDISFSGNGSYAAMQNLGNGNFTHGAAVTGIDLHISTEAGHLVKAIITEYAIDGGQTAQYEPADYLTTTSGEHVYHFDLTAPFTPRADRCYALMFYQATDPSGTTFYGWSSEKHIASSGGCAFGRNSDDVGTLNQNPSLNYPGLIDYSFLIYDDGNISPPPTEIVPQGKTYGSLDADFSFAVQGTMAAIQNLGNGSFAEGNAVTGVDVRVGAVPGNQIEATIREYASNGGQINEYFPLSRQPTIEGDHVYHFDFTNIFTPDPAHCYQLYSYQALSSAYTSTYYGHSDETYVASSTGCVFGYDSDDRANLLQNPSLNASGYIDYAFRLHTNGATSTTPVCTENCNSNVMFLPGVGGSRLYRPARADEAPLTEVRMWEPRDDVDVVNLGLNEQGKQEITSPQSEVYTRDVLDEAYVSNGGPNIYKSFMDSMDDLASSSKIAEWSAVPYDWRLSLDDILNNGTRTNGNISYLHPTTEPYIVTEFLRLASTSRTGKVTVVAHSNGGLVIKALLVAQPELAQYVDKLIFVAVPQVGTPQAVAAILHGNKQGMPSDYLPLIMSAQAGRDFSANAPVAYSLLPSQSYFTYVDDAVVTFDPATLPEWSSKYGNVIHSEESLDTYLTDSYERVSKDSSNTTMPIQANDFLLTQAQSMHASLDAWSPPQDIEVIQIAGWGIPKTAKAIEYSGKDFPCASLCGELRYGVSTTVDGDGTVVTPSALWMSATTGVNNYWVDLDSYNKEHRFVANLANLANSHKDILEIPNLKDFIRDTISSTTKPLSEYEYLSTTAPRSTDHRLRYELHSPLTLDLYDSLGRHTGVSTTTGEIEEQVLGTYYVEYGDVKYLFTDAASAAHIVLDGYDTGSFTLAVSELQGDILIASTTFKDMPTTPNTIATIGIDSNITTLTPLTIDLNGDGISEHTLSPVLNDVVTLPKPKLTVTTANQTMILGDAFPPLTATLIGFEGTDTATSSTTGSPICSTPIPIITVGTYSITCTQGTLTSEKYDFETFVPGMLTVLYRWSGFLQPIDDSVANPSNTPSVFKAGSAVPVKLQLKTASGQSVQASSSPIWLPPQKGAAMTATIDESIYSAPGTAGTTFKWDPATTQYQYNWKTDKSQAGSWYKIFVKLDDGTIKSVSVGLK